ncbi:MAG: NAD-dependent epimerase/dehydratase family protein [Maricaulis sp.]|jgi:dihydroflavonol-4-reductase|nr:NAD-dependent epimerase/dehydratase family protein [Maricaulis sp.]
MTQINPMAPVMVTGATGYLAGHVVKQLLEAGHTVHAPVRSPDNADKLKYLNAIAAGTQGQIKYFKADLLDEGSYNEAMTGCELVIHTASPFFLKVKDPQKDLIEPAVNGTRNVLNAVNATDSVKRVVLTSSMAAIYTDNTEIAKKPGGVLTEEFWNETASLTHSPYAFSKKLAEQEAWKMMKAQDRWDLVTINPSFLLGPGISPETQGESYSVMTQFGDGQLATGVPDFRVGVVDVRDVAMAHVRAGFTPAAEGRHITSGYDSGFPEMAKMLRDEFGDKYGIPKSTAPKFLIWLFGPMINAALTRTVVSRNVGVDFKADNSKSVRELGMEYRPMETTLVEHFQDLVDSGRIKAK